MNTQNVGGEKTEATRGRPLTWFIPILSRHVIPSVGTQLSDKALRFPLHSPSHIMIFLAALRTAEVSEEFRV